MMDATPPERDARPDEPADERAERGPDEVVVIAVTVTRTGGFAGLRRTWHARPDTAESPQWIALIDQCPWDAADPTRDVAPTGADRFVWQIDARCGDAEREAALADPEVQGPWRDLIDAVRSSPTTATNAKKPPRTAR